MTRLAYVTSFNKRIYEASGKKLLKSFYKTQSEGDLFCYYEEGTQEPVDHSNLKFISLDNEKPLQDWLQNNRDIIPESEGGTLKPCKCKNPWSLKEREHKAGCSHIWFKRCAYRWFKKVYSLNHFISTYSRNYDYVIWIDADCTFLRQVNTSDWSTIFGDHSILYMKGPREIEECGVVGYNLQKEGSQFIKHFYDMYIDGTFRKLARWDDSYVFHCLRETYPEWNSKDLAGKAGDHAEVISGSLIGNMIAHDKGKHGPRILGLFK